MTEGAKLCRGCVGEISELYIYLSDQIDRARELGLKLDNLKFGQTIVKVDPKYFRPTEVDLLIGDPTKANTKLGWKPKYDVAILVSEMMLSDLHLMKKNEYLKNGGFNSLNYFE